MSRSELPEGLAEEIRKSVFDASLFVKLTQVSRRGGSAARVSLRPVAIKGEDLFQRETVAEGQTTVKNFDLPSAREVLEKMLAQTGSRELHLLTSAGDLHLRVTKKGKLLESRGRAQERPDDALLGQHDRVKRQPLTEFDSAALLRVLGIADADGNVKSSRRGKYDQVNAFLKVIDTVVSERTEKTLKIVDCGCGRAYLTLAVYFYLTQVRGFEVCVCGIDRKRDVLDSARGMAQALDVSGQVTFIESDIADAEPPFEPDMVLSLHACDTATDEALARGIEWKCRYLLCAPCCQHELHKALKDGGAMQAVLRHGILRERLADLLTDTFRAQILRILGFRVNVVEFVAPDATARNILLKAEFAVKPGQQTTVGEYLELRDFWKVTPWLQDRMHGLLDKYLARY